MKLELQKSLKSGKKQIAVWGIGYIGYSSMAHFAREGIKCIGGDISKKVVDDIKKNGKSSIPNIEYWLDFDVVPLTKKGLITVTNNLDELIDEKNVVHLIAIPTEKNGVPYMDALSDVLTKIFVGYKDKKFKTHPLVIIESTISPNVINSIIIPLANKLSINLGHDVMFGVAPRRDWFVSPDKTLKTLPRIIGGSNNETTTLIEEVIGIVCDNILKAKDSMHACLVKSVENAYRQLDITFANQLTLAYPSLDILEVLRLVGTKWNVETYHPSFGVGGYCIPLAPYYVIDGAEKPDELTLLKESINTNLNQPDRVSQSIINRGIKNVGILGLAYTSDIKVDILSPTVMIVDELLAKGVKVKVNDPLYTDQEILAKTGAQSFRFPEDLDSFEAILIVAPHNIYVSCTVDDILSNLKNCRLILDNMGAWKEKKEQIIDNGIDYYEVGEANWLI